MSAISACSADSAGIRRSFVIEAAAAAAELPALRLDRINSRDLLAAARRVYFDFLAAGACGDEPLGVVLSDVGGPRGRVVFSRPVLLPDEEFVALELLRSRLPRAGGGRSNAARNRSTRTGTPL
ncbi:MAG: hypothetical protein ACKOBY_01010 [Cyanobium sp.]